MAKSIIDDKVRINNIIENIDFCIENIKNVSEKDFQDDLKIQYALCMSMQII